nr:uncharacterized protein LOC117223670 [Megalopta genalis]
MDIRLYSYTVDVDMDRESTYRRIKVDLFVPIVLVRIAPAMGYHIFAFQWIQLGRAKEWIIACDRRDLEKYSTEHVSKHYRLCEEHFEDKYLMRGKIRKNLTSNAVPTIFLCEEQSEVHRGTIGQELIISSK